MIIDTAKGPLDTDNLTVKDIAVTGDNGVPFRKIATEYWQGDELVRRDVTVTALRGIESQSIQGKLCG